MESRDFEVLKEIYNQVIDERVATFNTEHIDVDGIAGWTKSGLILVADSGRDVPVLCGHFLTALALVTRALRNSPSMSVNPLEV